MTITLPPFTPLEESLFLTLCCRALDNRSEQPILSDAMADEIVRELDYAYDALHISTDLMLNVTLRAKKLDEVASDSWPATERGGTRPGRRARHPRRPPRPAVGR